MRTRIAMIGLVSGLLTGVAIQCVSCTVRKPETPPADSTSVLPDTVLILPPHFDIPAAAPADSI